MTSKLCRDILHYFIVIPRRYYSSSYRKTHYEVLKLPQTCTAKEIKESFIKLSKENHPDVNKHTSSHKKFQEINEAYKILGKPELRRNYDLGFSYTGTRDPNKTYVNNIRPTQNPWHDPSFYQNRDRSQDEFYERKPYYGIEGVQRVSNGKIAILCIILTAIGLSVQVLLIRNAFTFRREGLLRRSEEAAQALNKVRLEANENGNDLQIKILKLKFEANKK